MNFVVSVIHSVPKPVEAAAFLCENLGFHSKTCREQAVIVENGAISIRLVTSHPTCVHQETLNLELQTQNLTQATDSLLCLPQVTLIAQHVSTIPERVENHLQAPHGIIITLAQEFDEDELGIIPPLPSSLIWDDDAEDCIKQMLRLIPISFRSGARTRITERAEMLAAEDAAINVNLANAIQALADCTPLFQHKTLISALRQRGIEASNFFNNRVPS